MQIDEVVAYLEEGVEFHPPTRPIRGPLLDGNAQGLPVRRWGLFSLDMISVGGGCGKSAGERGRIRRLVARFSRRVLSEDDVFI